MLIILDQPSEEPIEWPVSVNTPLPGGKTRKYEFTGIFRRLSAEERDELSQDIVSSLPTSEVEAKDKFIDKTMNVMVGWKKVVDQAQSPIEFSRETLSKAINSPNGIAIQIGINTALYEISVGQRQKN